MLAARPICLADREVTTMTLSAMIAPIPAVSCFAMAAFDPARSVRMTSLGGDWAAVPIAQAQRRRIGRTIRLLMLNARRGAQGLRPSTSCSLAPHLPELLTIGAAIVWLPRARC